MYSASNSFLGGANSARQQQQASPFQHQHQQQQPAGFPQHGLAPQPTGFPGGQQLQPQYTGFPGAANPTAFQQSYGQPSLQPPQQQQLQPQFTGFPGAAPQNQFAPSQPPQAPQQQNAAPQQFPSASAAPPRSPCTRHRRRWRSHSCRIVRRPDQLRRQNQGREYRI